MPNTRMKTLILAFTLCSLGAGTPRAAPERGDSVRVSMIQLIAMPEKFEGQVIAVGGFCTLMPEDFLLLPSKEVYEHSLDGSVWLSMNAEKASELQHLNKTYVEVIGTFTSKLHGHMGVSVGEIAVERMIPLPDNTERKSTWGCSKF